MEETVKIKWYFRLLSKLDDERTNVNMVNRVAAYVLDWIAASFVTAFPTVTMYMAITKTQDINQNLFSFPSYYGYIAGALSILFCMIYYVVLPLRKSSKGQTPGKRFMEVKIVKKDGSDVDLKTMLKRQVVGLLIVEGCFVAAGTYLCQILSMISGYNLTFVLGAVSALLCLASTFLALRTGSRRMLHDYIAGTKVISVHEE